MIAFFGKCITSLYIINSNNYNPDELLNIYFTPNELFTARKYSDNYYCYYYKNCFDEYEHDRFKIDYDYHAFGYIEEMYNILHEAWNKS